MTGDPGLVLWGFRYSVYTRIAKMVLSERGLSVRIRETDPFSDPPDTDLVRINPFRHVPVLDHAGFVLCETSAICRYIAAGFPGRPLVPDDPRAAARMDQVISVTNAHGYWPMVRQVFSHAVFRPAIGAAFEPDLIAEGLSKSAPVLKLFNDFAEEGLVLSRHDVTLADLYLAPMIGYFVMAPQGERAMRTYPALSRWWADMQHHPAYLATDPGLATLAAGS
jgi:glutathione S-transferase